MNRLMPTPRRVSHAVFLAALAAMVAGLVVLALATPAV